ATVEIAVWSNIEAGLGITAGSLATLRPLLRHWFDSSTREDYSSTPFPRSGSRLPGASRDRPYPLGSLDDGGQSRLRPDKVAVTVTTVHTHHDSEDRWRTLSGDNSSEERLTSDAHQGSGGVPSNDLGMGAGMGIQRVVEVTQTSSDAKSASIREHV
ncbi:hypothetical protein BJX61DRAFT_547121, partial [Aspergillus egyptiacus]